MRLLWIVILLTLPLCFAVSQDQEKEGEENSIYFHNSSAFRYPRERKAVSLQAATDIATHFDGTYGNINRISVQLTTLHANFYNQIIFAGSEWLSATSLNAGTASLNYAIWRFSLGVGYNYSRFINSEYSGPSLKICFWL